jgi:hypothetical protein
MPKDKFFERLEKKRDYHKRRYLELCKIVPEKRDSGFRLRVLFSNPFNRGSHEVNA